MAHRGPAHPLRRLVLLNPNPTGGSADQDRPTQSRSKRKHASLILLGTAAAALQYPARAPAIGGATPTTTATRPTAAN